MVLLQKLYVMLRSGKETTYYDIGLIAEDIGLDYCSLLRAHVALQFHNSQAVTIHLLSHITEKLHGLTPTNVTEI